MRANLGMLVFLLVGCGREIVDETPPADMPVVSVPTDAGVVSRLAPGWYDVPADPVQQLGVLEVLPADGRTLKAMFVFSATAPAGDYTVALAWEGATQLQVLGTARRDVSQFEARLAPPAEVVTRGRCGGSASGILFVLADGVVVGASAGGWVGDFAIDYDECGNGGRIGSVRLERDPRLEVARCRALGGRCVDTNPVRVTGGSIVIEDTGVAFQPEMPFIDKQSPVSVEVNGVVAQGRELHTGQTGVLSRALFREGKNRVTLRMGQRPAWEANVVLPTTTLAPQVSPALSLNKPFDLSVDDTSWATSLKVDLFPVDAPWTRAVYPSFSSPTSPIKGVFEGFPDGRGGRVTGRRASVQLSVTRTQGAFTMTQQTGFETPITP